MTGPTLGVYCPTRGRPAAVARLGENVRMNTTVPYELVFIVEKDDDAAMDAVLTVPGAWLLVNKYEPSYSNALQTAYEMGDHPYFIGANDDFEFQPGWDTAALNLFEKNQGHIKVVGVNDGSPNCVYSTISVVARDYIKTMSGVVDIPNRVNYPYKHNYVDTEFWATAKKRGVFAQCPESVVKHLHPDWGYGDWDEHYARNRATIGEDGVTYQSRRHLWA